MPKVEIDYSNTIIYKIICKDPSVKDMYVGHTTNFVQRKHNHKSSCCNNKDSPYNNCKLYQVIRNNGGWKNWSMEIVDFCKCNDLYEARKKEQEYFILLNATLNSNEPISKNNLISTKENEEIIVENKQLEKTSDNEQQLYLCTKCNYKCSKKFNLERHYLTSRHLKETKETEMEIKMSKNEQTDITCECGKSYKNKSGLWKHQKKCKVYKEKCKNSEENITLTTEEKEERYEEKQHKTEEELRELKTMFMKMIEINQDLQKQIVELAKESKSIINSNNTTNTTNNKFNLNIFLNEKCKDAFNITDFINGIDVGFKDFENFGRLGYVGSINNILIRELKGLDVYKRPIHCSDLKREVIHVKDNNTWVKDEDKKHMKRAIKLIEHKNIKLVPGWLKANPKADDISTKKHEEYMKILDNSMGEMKDEDNERNYEKIIKNVAKEILIDKEK
jgi:hypothetical protein